MKCLARLQIFGGGAPKSIYEYLSVLKQNNYSITTIAQPNEEIIYKRYLEQFDKIIFREDLGGLFDRRKALRLLKIVFQEKKTLAREAPDLVIVQGENNAFFYSYMCRKMAIPLIIIIAGGDLKPKRYLINGWECGEVICFSKENKDVIAEHYPEQFIHVISNRITIKQKFEDIEEHYICYNRLHILIVSRIDEDKISSITCFLDSLLNYKENDKLQIKIAGEGNMMENLRLAIKKVYGQYLNIDLLGHIDDLTESFKWAHIVVGKGRSVIEPIMMNRIGCIIANNGESCVCTMQSLENLYHYNFAGRNFDHDGDENSFTSVTKELLDGTYNLKTIHDMARKLEEYYSSEYLPEKFMKIVHSIQPRDNKKQRVYVFPKYISFMHYKIRYKVKRII